MPYKPNISLGPVVRSMVSANHWLSSIKINKLSWYLTLVSANQASNNSVLVILAISILAAAAKRIHLTCRWAENSGCGRNGVCGVSGGAFASVV